MVPTITPTLKQHQAYEYLGTKSPAKYVFFGGGAGGGKSWLGCEWLMTNCYFYPGSKWFIGREELKRLMNSTYLTFLKVCKHHQIPREDFRLDGKYNFIEFTNGSRIDLLDLKYLPTDPMYERLGSLEYTGGWIEEAGEVHFLAFDVLKSRVGRHLNRELAIPSKILNTLNPTKDWPYRLVYKPYKEGILSPDYAFIQSLYKDNPHTAEEYGSNLASMTDQAMKERLMYGNWEYDDDPTALMEYEAILDLFTNTAPAANDKFLVVDAARFGGDRIQLTLWQGLHLYKRITKTLQGTDRTEQDIRELEVSEHIPRSHVLVDEDGIGGGIVDHLKGCKGFTANSRPFNEENFENLKAQCAYKLAELVNKRQIQVTEHDEKEKQALIEELEQVKTKDADKDGKRKIIPKDEVKEKIGRSPDYSDCLLMRMYFEYQKTASNIPMKVQGGVRPYYDNLGI